MTHLPLRRLLIGGLAAAATCVVVPSTGTAKTRVHPDGPSCSADASFQSLKSVTDAVTKGVPFSFECVFYKDNEEISGNYIDPNTKVSDFKKRGFLPDPYVPKLDVSGTITLSAKATRFLHLSSRIIASGDLTGPVTITKDDTDTDIYRLHFKPSVAKLFRAQHAGTLVTDYDLTVKVLPGTAGVYSGGAEDGSDVGADAPAPGTPAPTSTSPSIQRVPTPGGTIHLSNDPDEPLEIIENVSAPCKHFLSGDGSAFGCAGGVGT